MLHFLSSPLFILLAIWSLVWKGLALWKAARNGQKGWYVALLIVNTAGILEIIYLYTSLSKPLTHDVKQP